ncbi:Uncharacterised protein [Bordetella ansorpii]|jgi:hypothetical protein|uniref:Uncharacterized protein n=1 Tax=Bordetella ansorpii TaxID=288768 RepID=A0A157RIP6_9BORD|nr:hypothetical protein [Bordetella ansorpii]SAI57863.1 Uncharacterised protein [Bordetella ansorpii]
MSSFPLTQGMSDPRYAAGVQFRVLALIFPVLRHEVMRPISNASLAAAMLRHVPEHPASSADAQHRQDDLIGDLEGMLSESTADVRRLSDWLEDAGGTMLLSDLLALSKKLVFTQLLRSGKQIHLPEQCPTAVLPEFAARYVLLAWLLNMLDNVPDGGELRIESVGADLLRAHAHGGNPGTATTARSGITADECIALAGVHGWQARRDDDAWTLRLPQDLS